MWEVSAFLKPKKPNSIDMVLIDEKVLLANTLFLPFFFMFELF